MSKRLWFSSTPVVIALAAACWVPACGGSSDSDGTAGSGGGFVMDSGQPDQSADTTTGDTTQPETGQPDASEESTNEAGVDVEILEGSLFDLTMPDVALNDAGATLQGCYDCTEVACPDQLAACEKNDNCRTLLLCFFQDGCFDPSQQYGLDTTCAFGCAGKAGISNLQDPAVALGGDVASCMQGACPEACGITDAGAPPADSGPDAVPDAVPDVQTEAAVDSATVDAPAE
jgi:hypothetical protein